MNAKAHTRTETKLLAARNELDFVRTLAPNALMPVPFPPKDRGIMLSSIGAMTVGIIRFFPSLIGRANLEIIVGGAAEPEMSSVAYGVNVMRHWLQTDEITFQLCGLGIDRACEHVSGDPMILDALANTNVEIGMLAHLMWRRRAEHIPLPDLITVLHPGIEYSRECWLKDEGLRDAAKSGVPVLLSAFAEREMRIDRMAFEAYGYKLSEPFQHRGAPIGMQPDERGKSADSNPRYGAWLYAITGVDTKRWRRPYQKLLGKALAKSNEVLPFDGHQKEMVLGLLNAGHRGGNAYARMEDGARLQKTSRGNNHPLFFCRFQMQTVMLGRPDLNDYYSGQLLRYGAPLGLEFVMPYLATNPDAIEARDEEGRTVVFHAIEPGDADGFANTDLLTQLVDEANLTVVDDQALTPLHVAIQRHNLRAEKLLLNAGAPMVSPPGAREMVEFLVDQRAWPQLQRFVAQYPAEAERAAANPVLVPLMLNAGAPGRLVKRFRAFERVGAPVRSTGSEAVKHEPQGDGFAISAEAAVNLMLAGHCLLRWTGSLNLRERTSTAEVGLAAELGDAELHRAIRDAEETGGKLHGVVITLYGAMVRLIVNLLVPDSGDESLVAGVQKYIRQIERATVESGFLADNAFRERALRLHKERHESRYMAGVGTNPDSVAPGKKKAATAKAKRR